jgi:hypothetical protein
LKLPTGAGDSIRQVDLTATKVGAVAMHRGADLRHPGSYTVFAQTINGTNLRSRRESDSGDEGAPTIVSFLGLSLTTDGRLWTLTGAIDGDGSNVPNAATITWLGSSCRDVFSNAPTPNASQDDFPAESFAVDGSTIYLYIPGTGIVTHPFVSTNPCSA